MSDNGETPPARANVATLLRYLHEERMATATTRKVAEPTIEVEYKKHAGDKNARATFHAEIPAGFDNDELERMYEKAVELLDRFIVQYESEDAPDKSDAAGSGGDERPRFAEG